MRGALVRSKVRKTSLDRGDCRPNSLTIPIEKTSPKCPSNTTEQNGRRGRASGWPAGRLRF
jgi:hypothetical protein